MVAVCITLVHLNQLIHETPSNGFRNVGKSDMKGHIDIFHDDRPHTRTL